MSCYKPNNSLREPPLQRALKSFIVSYVNEKYLTIAIRVLWNEAEEFNTMWEQRLKLEGVLKGLKQVVLFIDCITAMQNKKISCGFAFWIAYDASEVTAEAFENFICEKILETGFNIQHCKRAKTRGIFFVYL